MNRTLRNVGYVFVANVLVRIVSAVTAFFVARLLSPAEYGVWITLILVVSYAPIVCLGTVETLMKQYPYYVGKGDVKNALRLESGVLGSILLASGALTGGGFILSMIFHGKLADDVLRLGRIMLLTGGLSFVSAFFYYRFSAHQNFRYVGLIDTGRAVITFVCVVGLAWTWRLEGTVLGLLLSELVLCCVSGWLCTRMCGPVTPRYNLRFIWGLVKVGLPISVIWWVYVVQTTADRWISMSILGETRTGYYGLGVSLVSIVIMLPVALSRVLYPRVNQRIGETSDERDLAGLVVIPSHVLSVVMPAAIGLLIIGAPVLYHSLLPRYRPGLASAQILLLGSFFVCIVRTGANFLIATDRQDLVLKYVLFSLAINVLGNVYLARSGFGIEGIAFGSGLSAGVLATLVWIAVFKRLDVGWHAHLNGFVGLYLPYISMVLLIGLYAFIAPDAIKQAGPRLSVAGGAAFLVIFLLLMVITPTIRSHSMEVLGLLKKEVRSRVPA